MKKIYIILLIGSIFSVLAGLLSLIPWPSASYKNVFGYKSLCTFAPASLLFSLLIAGIFCFIRAAFIKPQDGTTSERFRRHAKSLIPLIIILIMAIASSFWFDSVKKYYMDTTASVSSVQE